MDVIALLNLNRKQVDSMFKKPERAPTPSSRAEREPPNRKPTTPAALQERRTEDR